MILLVSNIGNEAAPAWTNSCPAGALSLITASDFNESFKAGVLVNSFASSSLTFSGREIDANKISGVIATVPCFSPMEFYYIDPADRDYVCSEVNAFVSFFLSELKCKKINPPSRRSFSGLTLQKIEWAKIAHRLNIPVEPFIIKNGKHKYPSLGKHSKTFSCTIINGKIMESDMNEIAHKYVALLAGEFSLPYLTCYFSTVDNERVNLLDINSVPDITIPAYREAILNYF